MTLDRKHQDLVLAYTRSCLEAIPEIYLGIMKFRYRRSSWQMDRLVGKHSWLCIEGYPRSANSFLLRGIHELCRGRSGQTEKHWGIATHVHSPAHVKCALRRDIPTAIVIRDPVDAAISYKALALETFSDPLWKQKVFRAPNEMPLKTLVMRFVEFYRPLQKDLDRIAVYTFDTITNDIQMVISDLNERFNLGFTAEEIRGLEPKDLLKEALVHLGPSSEREQIKRNLKEEAAKLEGSASLDEAYVLWEKFSDRASCKRPQQ